MTPTCPICYDEPANVLCPDCGQPPVPAHPTPTFFDEDMEHEAVCRLLLGIAWGIAITLVLFAVALALYLFS